MCGVNIRSNPRSQIETAPDEHVNDAVGLNAEPANTSLMIVDERSPLDLLFIKELDFQPFPYYFSITIVFNAVLPPARNR